MRSGNAQRKMRMYSARRPTESTWLENVVDLEEANKSGSANLGCASFQQSHKWIDLFLEYYFQCK